MRVAMVAVLFAATAAAEPPPPPKVSVAGAVESPQAWTADDLAKAFAADIKVTKYTTKGAAATARTVPLLKLVEAAKPKVDPKRKGHLLAFSAVVRGGDGYAVSFALGELSPETAGGEVLLALDRDGQPLDEAHRPASLLVPGDKKPARWVRGVVSVTLIDGLAKP